jgi:UDP-glucose:glycoprotein glucosyltransferase
MFGGPIIRIDMSKGGKYVVYFINNLEKDAQYKQWPRSLKQLLYPSWSLHTIARNMYTLIMIIDIFSSDGAQLLYQMNMMMQQQFPIRFGMVFR